MMPACPMPFDHLLHALRRRLAWLLCVAVLLPGAQLAATAHAMSHEFAASGIAASDLKGDVQHCAWCVAAAASTSAAPPAAPPVFLASHAAPGAPLRVAIVPPQAAPTRRPANRGPPALLQ
jgi:hypothetical protein